MRISDWSSDVCSSDLGFLPDHFHAFAAPCDVFVGVVEIGGRKVERRFQFGNMVLSRWPILTVRSLLLPRSRTFDRLNLQRGAIEVVIDAPGGPLRVYSVHLDHVSRSEEHTSELQSLMRISYAVFCLKKKKQKETQNRQTS